jgi:hypothetical protein
VRRALLVLMVVSLVGLTSAVASSFSANVEDVESFTTAVSLTTPGDAPVPFPPVLWLRGTDGAGTLDFSPPPTPDVGWTKHLELGGEEVDEQLDPDEFVTWRGPTATVEDLLLDGDVTLFLDQDGADVDRMSAALFICPPAAPLHSHSCTEIVNGVGTSGVSQGDDEVANDFEERQVHFGRVDATVPRGMELRLKVTDRKVHFTEILSTQSWNVLWGYRSDRQSRLEITP